MSVPLDGIAIQDTEDRIRHARQMEEYRKTAREELDYILAYQKEHPGPNPTTLTAPKHPISSQNRMEVPGKSPGKSPAKSPTKSPVKKVAKKLKNIFSGEKQKKRSTVDDFSDIRRAMGEERLEHFETESDRTEDTKNCGEMGGEGSSDWDTESVTALPRMPSTNSVFATQRAESRRL